MPSSSPTISVVIPCFNEKDAIEGTVKEIRNSLAGIGSYELIVVDDGSDDGSSDIVAGLVSDEPAISVVTHEENLGYGAALKSGIRHASGELIAITDADGTYPNERLPDLIEACASADMVVGARTGESVEYPTLRRIPKAILSRYCAWIANRKIPDMNSGLRVFRKDVVERYLHLLPNSFSFTTTITLAFMTNDYNVRFIPIDYAARIGKSKIRPIRDTLRFFQLIVRSGTYFAPLRAFTPLIVVFSLAFIASAAYDIISERNLTDKTLIFLMFCLNTALFALLADVIAKRSGR